MRTATCLRIAIPIFLASVPALAQQPGGGPPSSQGVKLPLSGRGDQLGSVDTARSTNPGASPTSANLSINTVQVQGSFNGSVPSGTRSTTPVNLSLDEAIRRGLQYNLATSGFSNALRASRGQQLAARSALLPNVSGHLLEDVQQTDLQALGLRGGAPGLFAFPTVVGPFNYFDLRTTLTQTVADLTALRNLRAAKEEVKATQFAAKDARDMIVLAVSGTYLQLIAAEARVTSEQAQVKAAQAVYQQAADRNKAGLNAHIDALRAQVELQIEQQRLRSLQLDQDKQKLNLARIIGLPLGQQFNITDSIPYAPLEGITLEDALNRAYANRSDMRSAEAQVKAADYARGAAKAEYYPTLGFSADYGAIGINPSQSHGTFTFMGTLKFPIYQGGRVHGDIEQADAALSQRKAELEDLKGRVDYEVRSAFLDLQAATDQVRVSKSNTGLAQETLTQAEDRFRAGVADTIEVVQAQESVAAANEDYISSLYTYNLAKVSLARAIGTAERDVKQFLGGK
ncbi:MAG TPA: TolC family protein [Bryobacteraceae bacterium]|nr:TolC family protein [Bryobacteraceae bacterium]